MEKILYHTYTFEDEDEKWEFEYYITKTLRHHRLYYGVLVSSHCEDSTYTKHVVGIFPYQEDAIKFADMLYKYQVTPLSLTDTVVEYFIEKVVLTL